MHNIIVLLTVVYANILYYNVHTYDEERVSEQYTSNYDYHSFPFCYFTKTTGNFVLRTFRKVLLANTKFGKIAIAL